MPTIAPSHERHLRSRETTLPMPEMNAAPIMPATRRLPDALDPADDGVEPGRSQVHLDARGVDLVDHPPQHAGHVQGELAHVDGGARRLANTSALVRSRANR